MNGRDAMELRPVPMQANTPTDAADYTMFSREAIDTAKRTIAAGTSDLEFALFLQTCRNKRVDPLAKLIYPVKRWSADAGTKVMALQASIDYFRLTAQRSNRYAGQLGPLWCGKDGVWTDVWLKDEPPAAAKVGVLCEGFREPLWSVALWTNYVQTTKDGHPTKFWKTMGPLMLAKCAESLGLRRAFPEDLAGLYTAEEMDQAVHDAPAIAPSKPAGTLTERVQAREAPKAVAATVVQPAGSQEALAPLPPKGDPQASAPLGAEVPFHEVYDGTVDEEQRPVIRSFQFQLPPIDQWFDEKIGGKSKDLAGSSWAELHSGHPPLVKVARTQVAKSWQKVAAGGQLSEPEMKLIQCLAAVDEPNIAPPFDWGSGSTDGAKAVTT